jgi:hypothetical protein
MIKPTIHLNGTDLRSLKEQAENAGRALAAAIGALHDASPNGRDYYPQGDDAGVKARAEHTERMQSLYKIQDEFRELYEYLEEAEISRSKR